MLSFAARSDPSTFASKVQEVPVQSTGALQAFLHEPANIDKLKSAFDPTGATRGWR